MVLLVCLFICFMDKEQSKVTPKTKKMSKQKDNSLLYQAIFTGTLLFSNQSAAEWQETKQSPCISLCLCLVLKWKAKYAVRPHTFPKHPCVGYSSNKWIITHLIATHHLCTSMCHVFLQNNANAYIAVYRT